MSDPIPTAAEMTAPKFLGANDLVLPRETVTIKKIRRTNETFEAGKKDTVNVFSIVRQSGATSEVLFCKTNVFACRVLFGDDTKAWIGKKLVLIVDQDLYANDTVDCIRIEGSPDAAPARMSAYQETFNDPAGRPRKLIKRLKLLVSRLKRTEEPDIAGRIAAMRKTLGELGVADELILAAAGVATFEEITTEGLVLISAWWAKNQSKE